MQATMQATALAVQAGAVDQAVVTWDAMVAADHDQRVVELAPCLKLGHQHAKPCSHGSAQQAGVNPGGSGR